MEVEIYKITDLDFVKDMLTTTTPGLEESQMTLETMYKRGHSIMRSQLFYVKLIGIPSFVAGHLRTHGAAGQFWLTQSSREDWGAPEDSGRDTLINQVAIFNAEHLIQLAKLRLCGSAHIKTQGVVQAIKETLKEIDPDLAKWMVPKCYFSNFCNEHKSCGKVATCAAWRKEMLWQE